MGHDDWAGKTVLVLGLGDTGLSCVRFLAEAGARLRGADTRAAPPALGAVLEAAPGIRVDLGALPPEVAAEVVEGRKPAPARPPAPSGPGPGQAGTRALRGRAGGFASLSCARPSRAASRSSATSRSSGAKWRARHPGHA